MTSSRRMPNLFLSLLVLLAVTGIALLCIAIVARQLQQAVNKAQEAAERKQQEQSTAPPEKPAEKPQSEAAGSQATDGPAEADGGLSEAEIRARAAEHKQEWLAKNPDKAFDDAAVSKVEKTSDGWQVVFGGAGSSEKEEGGSPPQLHVYVDPEGALIKVARQPVKAD